MESWKIVKNMGGELCSITIKKFIKGSGKMIKREDTVLNYFLMVAFIKETIKMESLKGMVVILGPMDSTTMANGSMGRSTVLVCGEGLKVILIRANGD